MAKDLEEGTAAVERPNQFKNDSPVATPSPYDISSEDLNKLSTDKDSQKLQELGGVQGLAAILGSDLHSGLDTSATDWRSLDARRSAFGANILPVAAPKSFFYLCWQNLQDPIILLLVAAAAVSTVLGAAIKSEREEKAWVEGVAIWIAVGIVTCVGAGNDWQKDRQFRKLNAEKDVIYVKVLRNKEQTTVVNSELLVGDIVLLDSGDKVLADGILIDSMGLILDEASLTGESEPIKKNVEHDPWVRSGTQVDEGSGRILVVAVGLNSEWGKALSLVAEAGEDQTPLQVKLEWVAGAIGKVGLSVAVACFIALLIKWCVKNKGFPIKKINDNGPVQFFLYCVTIIVVAIPEGLPLAVTISLAYSMRKMMQDNNFVRVLAACETMGGVNAICSDKTGTLTENRMTVTQGWFGGKFIDHTPSLEELTNGLAQLLSDNIALSSKAFLMETPGIERVDFVGNRTECALLMLMRKLGLDYRLVREQQQPNIFRLYGFTSARKMSCVLVRQPDGSMRVHNKGAAEWVLRKCISYMDEAGNIQRMTESKNAELEQQVFEMANRGLRCIALSFSDISAARLAATTEDYWEDAANVDRDLTLVTIVGIKDPVRQEVPHAVEVCQRAGITVRMVTGDNIHTAKHIARECGILVEEDHLSLEGPAFRTMDEAELLPLLPKLRVLARSSPEDKLTLVRMLKKHGDVVAVTGDGTNDAPALKESDVGLAMGIAGTEVAKEAADIIIMDDNFRSIVQTVLWGRSVFTNIRKFLQFQLTVNFVALVTAFVGAVVGGHEPLTVLQLLWVNLIMDTMGALALATEPPTQDLLLQKPNGRHTRLITTRMWKHILVQGAYQLFWMFFFLYGLKTIGIPRYNEQKDKDLKLGLSLLFNAFIMCQLANEVNSRRINDEYDIFSGFFKSPIFICVIGITAGLQAIIINFLGFFFKVEKLDYKEWLVSIAIGVGAFPVSLITRWVSRCIEGPPHARYKDLAEAEALKASEATSAQAAHMNAEQKATLKAEADNAVV